MNDKLLDLIETDSSHTPRFSMTLAEFKRCLTEVVEWNVIAGTRLDTNTEAVIDTYQKLSEEELQEFTDALLAFDVGEMVDALCDMAFVVGYGAIAGGLSIDDVEPMSGTYFDLSQFIKSHDLKSAINVLAHIFTSGNPLLGQSYVDYHSAFRRVVESNYSKYIGVDPEIDDAYLQQQCKIIEEKGDYGDVSYDIRMNGTVAVLLAGVDKRPNTPRYFDMKKIVKPTTFNSVESLGGLLEFIYE